MKVKHFAFLQYWNIIKPKTVFVFKAHTLFSEGMSQNVYFSEKKIRLKVMFKISNLTVFIYHAKEEFYNQSSEELPVTRSGLK